MNSAERFANLLTITEGDPELRRAGLDNHRHEVHRMLEVGNIRLVAMNDGSILMDRAVSEVLGNELTAFDDDMEMAHYLAEQLREGPEAVLTLINGMVAELDKPYQGLDHSMTLLNCTEKNHDIRPAH